MARTAQTRLIASRSSRMYALPTLIHGVITVYIWEVLSRSSARHHHGDLHGARSAPQLGVPTTLSSVSSPPAALRQRIRLSDDATPLAFGSVTGRERRRPSPTTLIVSPEPAAGEPHGVGAVDLMPSAPYRRCAGSPPWSVKTGQ
jgi:hypothetical protein